MNGIVKDAEKLFSNFAERHHLRIRKVPQDNIELMMLLPRQESLSFELTLGLQNYDN